MGRTNSQLSGGGKLPNGYTPVRYLYSKGAYINTGIYPSSDTNIDCLFRFYNSGTTARTAFGAYCSNPVFNIGFQTLNTAFRFYVSTNNNLNYYYDFSVNENNKYPLPRFTFFGNNITFGDVTTTIDRKTSSARNVPIYIFVANVDGTAGVTDGTAIAYFKIYDGETLVRDYVPCLDDNNVPCMYDKVTKTPYYNAGTGNFTYFA